jgi:tRNA A-37 threonylcarbamoyl transferase component Bud32
VLFLARDFLFNNSIHKYPDSHQLLPVEELCLTHECGVVHGDLWAPNIILQNGSDAHFIDFSNGYEHQCTGPTRCFELKNAR